MQNYYFISYYNLSASQHKLFFNFLKECSKEITQPAHKNMWDENWQHKNNTLPYILENTLRFRQGGVFQILFDNKTIVGCSGIYTSHFCNELAIAGTRTWISKDYRNKLIVREILLPTEKKWAIDNQFKAVAICFNEYNKNLSKAWRNIRLGETRLERKPHHLFFNGINEVEFPVIIQSTKQWIMYEKLDNSFSYDWTNIKWSKK